MSLVHRHTVYIHTPWLGADYLDTKGTACYMRELYERGSYTSRSGLCELATTPSPSLAVYRLQSSWNEGRLGRGQTDKHKQASKLASMQALNSC